MKKYDYIVVGAGLYGATLTNLLIKANKSVLVVEKRHHIGGNIYTKKMDNIDIHLYGPHIFHTDYEDVWNYVNSFVPFQNYINQVLAFYKGKYYHMPFNMYTYQDMWGVTTPEEAKAIIEKQIKDADIKEIKNLQDQAISLVGTDIYQTLIKGYTEKQWGRKATELPSFIIKRLPLRFEFNNNYYNDKYQGIPACGYTKLIEKMIEGATVLLGCDFLKRKDIMAQGKIIIFTGAIDEFFDYKYGPLEYRSLRFETIKYKKEFFQNNCVINYTDFNIPYTRVFEHKYFNNAKSKVTYITREYPDNYEIGKERYYPINNEKNNALYKLYEEDAKKMENVFFGGRLGQYKYYDMDDTIKKAFEDFSLLLKE